MRYPAVEQPSFALVLKGTCWLAVDGILTTTLNAGDFVLFPAMPEFTLASERRVAPRLMTITSPKEQVEEVIHGDAALEPSVSMLGGYFTIDLVNASLLLNLLPQMLHIRGSDPAIGNVATIVTLIQREVRENRAGRALVVMRLIEVMLVEALRSTTTEATTTGLLAGLQDRQLRLALRAIHTNTAHSWTLTTLAREATMSRSAFAERFSCVIGTTPLHYLLQWRLAVAKDMLVREQKTVSETAFAIGYQSASAFSTAFSREMGQSPKEFVRKFQNDT